MAPTLAPRRRKFRSSHSTLEKSGPWTVGAYFVLSFGLICLIVLVLFVIYKTRKQRREIRQQNVNAEIDALAKIREDQLEKARSRSRVGTANDTRVIGPPSERESMESLISRPRQARIASPPRMRMRIAPLKPKNRHGGLWSEAREYEEELPATPPLPLLMILSRTPQYSSFPSSVHPAQRDKKAQNRRRNGTGTLSRQVSVSISEPTATHLALLPSPPESPTRSETPVKRRKLYEKPEKEWISFQKNIPVNLPLRLKNNPMGISVPPSFSAEEVLRRAFISPHPTTPTEETETPDGRIHEKKTEQTPFVEEILEEASKIPLPTTPTVVLLAPAPEQDEKNKHYFAEKALSGIAIPEQYDNVYSSLQEWHRARVNSLSTRTRELEGDVEKVIRRVRSM